MQRIRQQQWSTKIKDTLIKNAVNKTTAEALAAVWTNTADSKSPDDKIVEAFVEMVQDAGVCASALQGIPRGGRSRQTQEGH
jgi:hypothetical protein